MSDQNSRILSARLLRVIASDLAQRIIPDLKSADALERASLARLSLIAMADDLDVLPRVAAERLPALLELLEQPKSPAAGSDQPAVTRARQMATNRLRGIADPNAANAAVTALARWDADWVLAMHEAAAAHHAEVSARMAPGTAEATVADTVTPETVTRYLRRVWPEDAAARATQVIPIPGGRSKKTYLVAIDGSRHLPADIVIRQDYALKYVGTKVAEEHRPLQALAELQLPVPRPLHLEREPSELGPPFLIVNRLSGKPPGTYFSEHVTCAGAFRELAAMLGRLHQVDPATLGAAVAETGKDYLHALILQYRQRWRDNVTRPSPIIDFAYLWAERQCAQSRGAACYVHGDCGPHNLLVDGDRLSALLDWEFSHLGDPAEDLGIARVYVESCMPWSEFLSIYRAAGGIDVPESRVQLGMVVQFLKGSILTATSGRNFLEGATHELVKGASSFTGLRMVEVRIAKLLRSFGAL